MNIKEFDKERSHVRLSPILILFLFSSFPPSILLPIINIKLNFSFKFLMGMGLTCTPLFHLLMWQKQRSSVFILYYILTQLFYNFLKMEIIYDQSCCF